jgi:hypothetical protein
MFIGYGNMGFQKFPNRMLESGSNEFGRYGALFDWDAGYGITLNGTDVSGWKDKIQGINWEQTTAAAQPQYATSVINGNNAVFANSISKFMETSTSININLGSDYWLAWVFLDNNAGTVVGPNNIGGGQGNIRVLLGDVNQVRLGTFCTSQSTLSLTYSRYVVAGSDANWYIVIFTRTKIFVNGVSEPIVGVADYRSTIPYNKLFRSTNSNSQTTGYLSRLLIGNQALSDSSLLELSDALNSKYLIY